MRRFILTDFPESKLSIEKDERNDRKEWDQLNLNWQALDTNMKLSCIYDPSDEVTFNISFTFSEPELWINKYNV